MTAINELCNKKKGRKATKKTRRPKQALTAYNLFHLDDLKKMGERGSTKKYGASTSRAIGAKWNSLDAPTRCLYEVDAMERKRNRDMYEPRTFYRTAHHASILRMEMTYENQLIVNQSGDSNTNIPHNNSSENDRILRAIYDTKSFLDDDFYEFVLSTCF